MIALREGFSAVNARFHLVGLYALVGLLVRFAGHWTGDDPDGNGLLLMLTAFLLYIAVESGAYGVLFQAAMGPREAMPFARWAAVLVPPLFWLRMKIGLLQIALLGLAATAHNLARGGTPEASMNTVAYWGLPLFDFLTQILMLYSAPICVLARVRREWRPAIREGLKMYRVRPAESAQLLLPLLLVTLAGSGLHFALGQEGEKAPPGYAEGFVTLAGAYLTLAVFFAASRIVLTAPAREAAPDAGAPLPGPGA